MRHVGGILQGTGIATCYALRRSGDGGSLIPRGLLPNDPQVAAWVAGSFFRSEDWSAPDRLRHQVLRLYPRQLRVINGLRAEDNRVVGRWQGVLDRPEDFLRCPSVVTATVCCNWPNAWLAASAPCATFRIMSLSESFRPSSQLVRLMHPLSAANALFPLQSVSMVSELLCESQILHRHHGPLSEFEPVFGGTWQIQHCIAERRSNLEHQNPCTIVYRRICFKRWKCIYF